MVFLNFCLQNKLTCYRKTIEKFHNFPEILLKSQGGALRSMLVVHYYQYITYHYSNQVLWSSQDSSL